MVELVLYCFLFGFWLVYAYEISLVIVLFVCVLGSTVLLPDPCYFGLNEEGEQWAMR